ncbi:PRC-barrel domain-containing protein [Saccharopolyspora indica]|uniref:PRC-barrel domain-containing protein n=1 Tax=Saccharopolyspora indica TaxID=1229659 RepID=UPI0022EAE0C7|nr:PRC-barrel domain-containing protein [Saccharopolyspora indica]MDA3644894.1 PRC-barrel domain-containing protein [Saccharopolyspora indica]
MIGQREALRMFGCEVFDPAGHRMGIVGQLFVDDDTEQPAWVTVQTGLFGTNESFVPLAGAAFDGDALTVAVDREAVRSAPRILLDQGDLPPAQERELCLHYGLAPDGCADDPETEHAEAARLRVRRWAAAT